MGEQTAWGFPRRRQPPTVQARLEARGWQRRASCFVYLPPKVQETRCQRSLTKPVSQFYCYWCLCLFIYFIYLFWHDSHIWDRRNNFRNKKKHLMDVGCGSWWKAMIFKWHWWDYYCTLMRSADSGRASVGPPRAKRVRRLAFAVFRVCCTSSDISEVM